MALLPLLVFDTNVLVDIWLGRNQEAELLLGLGERRRVEILVPEYVLHEFRGTALRTLLRYRDPLLSSIRQTANGWEDTSLGTEAAGISEAAAKIEVKLNELASRIAVVDEKVRGVGQVVPHNQAVHFQGDLRSLSGRAPHRMTSGRTVDPVGNRIAETRRDGIDDCRIYEAVLEIARGDRATSRSKYFLTHDQHFSVPDVTSELEALGFKVRGDLGRVFGELKRP